MRLTRMSAHAVLVAGIYDAETAVATVGAPGAIRLDLAGARAGSGGAIVRHTALDPVFLGAEKTVETTRIIRTRGAAISLNTRKLSLTILGPLAGLSIAQW